MMTPPYPTGFPHRVLRRGSGGGLALGILLFILLTGLGGSALGNDSTRFKLTYYYVAEQIQQGGNWPLYGNQCKTVLARVSKRFHHDISLEGTGRLKDGRIINFLNRCDCARPGFRGNRICYTEVDEREYPWGFGAQRIDAGPYPLNPYRTVAVDPSLIPLGTTLYIPLFDGKTAPNGKVLDGCFFAGDVGSAIKGRHLDLFVGKKAWAPFAAKLIGRNRVKVYDGADRC